MKETGSGHWFFCWHSRTSSSLTEYKHTHLLHMKAGKQEFINNTWSCEYHKSSSVSHWVTVQHYNMWSVKDHTAQQQQTLFQVLLVLVSAGSAWMDSSCWSLLSCSRLAGGGAAPPSDLLRPGNSHSWSLVTARFPAPSSPIGFGGPPWGPGPSPAGPGSWCTWVPGAGSHSCWASCRGGVWGWDAAAQWTLH